MPSPSEAIRKYIDGEITSTEYFQEIREEVHREAEELVEKVRRTARSEKAPEVGGIALGDSAAVVETDSKE